MITYPLPNHRRCYWLIRDYLKGHARRLASLRSAPTMSPKPESNESDRPGKEKGWSK